MKYSKTTGGFYDAAIHGAKIPSDAVEVPSDLYNSLMAAQSSGKVIQSDIDGMPMALDYEPSAADLVSLARAERNARLLDADRAINKAEDNGRDASKLRAWRQSLRDWPESKGFPDVSTLPMMP